MLERLDEVKWGDLQAACGPAEWVPETLRGLLDHDPYVRAEMLDLLEGGTFHQSGPDEATPYVVRFLSELAADPATPDRHRLLVFVAGFLDVFPIDPDEIDEVAAREGASRIPEDPDPMRSCLAAAWHGASDLMEMLEDGDPAVRVHAGLVLALLGKGGEGELPADGPARIAGRLRDVIEREDDPAVRAGQVLALGTVSCRAVEALGWLVEIEAAADLDDPAGLAAALRLIDLGRRLDRPARDRFIERTLRFDAAACRLLPWWYHVTFYEEPKEIAEVDAAVRRRFRRLAGRHPEVRAAVEERAAAGPPVHRANALRLLSGRGAEDDDADEEGPAVEVEADADIFVRLAAAELLVTPIGAEPVEVTLPAAIEALNHPDASIRLRGASLIRPLEAFRLSPRADELAAVVRDERDPSVLEALARVVIKVRRSNGQVLRPFSLLPRGWLDATDGPRGPSVRRSLWECLRVQATQAPDEAMGRWLVDRIEHPGSTGAVDGDRAEAVAVLRNLDLPGWDRSPMLDRLLRSDPDPRVRRAAVESLLPTLNVAEKLPPAAAIVAAYRVDPSEAVRFAASGPMTRFLIAAEPDEALVRAVVCALVDALEHDPSYRVRLSATYNLRLAALSPEEARREWSGQNTRTEPTGPSQPGNEDAIDALVRAAADDPRYSVRDAACESLRNVAAAVPGLLALLRSAPPQGRAGAAKALASAGQPATAGAVPEILDILPREPDVIVRQRIAETLFHLLLAQDVSRRIVGLARALRDPDDEVRHWIARGLTHAGPAAAPLARELAACLGSGHQSLPGDALIVLANIGPGAGAALPAVMALVRSPSIAVRLLALRAAWAMNGDRPPHLDEMLDALMKPARDSEPRTRSAAMRQLGAIAEGLAPDRPQRKWAVAMLIAGRSDPDNDVRDAAGRGLRETESTSCSGE